MKTIRIRKTKNKLNKVIINNLMPIMVASSLSVYAGTVVDTDSDGIPDFLDAMPLNQFEVADTDADGIGDNADPSDVVSTSGASLSDINTLITKFVEFNTGEGAFSINGNGALKDRFDYRAGLMNSVISDANTNYDSYNIVLDSNDNVTSGNPLIKADFDLAMKDFYNLALQANISNNPGLQEKSLNFYKYLRFVGVTSAADGGTEIVDDWYLSTLGMSLILIKEQLAVNNLLDDASELLWNGGLGKDSFSNILQNNRNQADWRSYTIINVDLVRSQFTSLLAGALILDDSTPEKIQLKLSRMQQVKEFLVELLSVAPSISPFMKPDFTANHHFTNYISGYVPQAIYALARAAYLLKDTPWQLSDNELYYIRGFAKNAYFYANLDHVPTGLSGRLVNDSSQNMLSATKEMLPLLAVAGDSADQDLLKIISQIMPADYGNNDLNNNYSPTYRVNQNGFPGEVTAYQESLDIISKNSLTLDSYDDFRVFPFSAFSAKRQDDWSLTIKGLDKWTWSYEGGLTASNPQNAFGLYQSYGQTELHYIDNNNVTLNPMYKETGGFDWTHFPGTTVPARTLDEMRADQVKSRYKIDSTDTGGVKLLNQRGSSDGLFMLDLNFTSTDEFGNTILNSGIHDHNFSAKKSWFSIGDKIIALGSNINNASTVINGLTRDYNIHTTLFQNYIGVSNDVNKPIVVDGTSVTDASYNNVRFNPGESDIIDVDGTGYYVKDTGFAGLNITRQHTTSRTPRDDADSVAYRAISYIDHGRSPTDAKYEYVILPNSDTTTLTAFTNAQDSELIYQVLQQDSSAHIVHDIQYGIWGYALFEDFNNSSQGPINSVKIHQAIAHPGSLGTDANNGYAIMADDSTEDGLKLAVTYTDLRLFKEFRETFGVDSESVNDNSAPVIVEVKVAGSWDISDDSPSDAGVTVYSKTASETILHVYSKNGLAKNISLETSSNLLTVDAPSGLTVNQGNSWITINWNPETNNNFSHWKLLRSTDGVQQLVADNITETFYRDHNFSDYYHAMGDYGNKDYEYALVAVDRNSIETSEAVSINTLHVPFTSINLAEGKKATSTGNTPEDAVDGTVDTFSTTSPEVNPWLDVDLETISSLSRVSILGRKNNPTYYPRMSNVHVMFSSFPFEHSTLADAQADCTVQQLGNTGTVTGTVNIEQNAAKGRYIRLWMEDAATEYFQVGEVQAWQQNPEHEVYNNPLKPDGFEVTTTDTTANLTWNNDTAANFSHWRLYRSADCGSLELVADIITSNSISDNILAGVKYQYSLVEVTTSATESEPTLSTFVESFSSQNVALNKPTKSTGTKAFRAVDGDTNNYSLNPVETNPYLQVDLESITSLEKIVIVPNGTKYSRISNVYVLVSDQEISDTATLAEALNDSSVETRGHTGTVSGTVTIELSGSTQGRYIRLWMEGDTEQFQVAELEVWDAEP